MKDKHDGNAVTDDLKAEDREVPVSASTFGEVKQEARGAASSVPPLPTSTAIPRDDSAESEVKSEADDNQTGNVTDANSGSDAGSDIEAAPKDEEASSDKD